MRARNASSSGACGRYCTAMICRASASFVFSSSLMFFSMSSAWLSRRSLFACGEWHDQGLQGTRASTRHARAFSFSSSSSQCATASRSSFTSSGLAWCKKLRAQTAAVKVRPRRRAGPKHARSAHALVGVARLGKRVQLRQREDAALALLFTRAALHSHLRTRAARASAALARPTGRSSKRDGSRPAPVALARRERRQRGARQPMRTCFSLPLASMYCF